MFLRKDSEIMVKNYNKAIFDGMINAYLIFIIEEYIFSEQMKSNSNLPSMLLILLCTAISVGSSICCLRDSTVNGMLKKYGFSILSFFAFMLLFFMIYISGGKIVPAVFGKSRVLVDADGLLLFFYEGIYLVSVLTIHCFVLLIRVIMFRKKNCVQSGSFIIWYMMQLFI